MGNRARPWRERHQLIVLPAVLVGLVATVAPLASGTGAGSGVSGPTPVSRQSVVLLPDMTPLKARDMVIYLDDGHRRLRFTAGLANIGRGPMEVRPNNTQPCAAHKRHASQIIYRDLDRNHFFRRSVDVEFTRRSAGCMVFHPQHNHWHFEAASRYTVYRPESAKNILVRARKMSFCLRDSELVPARLGTFHHPQYYRECGRDTAQGISTGWVDVYSSIFSARHSGCPTGSRTACTAWASGWTRCNELRESDEYNNESSRPFRLHGDRALSVKTDACRLDRS